MHDDPLPAGRSWHDMGGLPAGPVAPEAHDFALWEKRVDALMSIASRRGLFTVDGMRRALEEMGPQAFEGMSYYERWIAAVARNLIDAGLFTAEELNAKLAEVAARGDSYAQASGGGDG